MSEMSEISGILFGDVGNVGDDVGDVRDDVGNVGSRKWGCRKPQLFAPCLHHTHTTVILTSHWP